MAVRTAFFARPLPVVQHRALRRSVQFSSTLTPDGITNTKSSAIETSSNNQRLGPAPVTEVSRLEIRVGKIVEVDVHPTLPKIFVEKIDLGEAEGPRTICSGLQGFLTKEDLFEKSCLVLANLKPRDLEGTPSNGMVLCASSSDHSEVQLVVPPEGAQVGELVTFEGHASEPVDAGNRAVKSWKKVGGNFATDADGVAWYTGEDTPAKMNTSAGPCTAVIKNGNVS